MRLPNLPAFAPRLRLGVWEYPVHYMRGGTSTGLVLWEPFVPAAEPVREELLRHLLESVNHALVSWAKAWSGQKLLGQSQRFFC